MLSYSRLKPHANRAARPDPLQVRGVLVQTGVVLWLARLDQLI